MENENNVIILEKDTNGIKMSTVNKNKYCIVGNGLDLTKIITIIGKISTDYSKIITRGIDVNILQDMLRDMNTQYNITSLI